MMSFNRRNVIVFLKSHYLNYYVQIESAFIFIHFKIKILLLFCSTGCLFSSTLDSKTAKHHRAVTMTTVVNSFQLLVREMLLNSK